MDILKGDDFDCPKEIDVRLLNSTFYKWQDYKSKFIGNLPRQKSLSGFSIRNFE